MLDSACTMSDSNPGWIQAQWNLLETALLAKDAVVSILRACAEEDVQGQAVLALEGLGFGLTIDEKRREEGAKALRTFKSRVIHQLKLTIGLSKGGLSMHMSKSQNLIASFLMVCACKICFKDETTAAILYEMIKNRGVYERVPVLPWQISQVISSISGYSENLESILPSHVFGQVLENVQRRLTPQDPIDEYIGPCATATIGHILSDVFTALQNIDVRRVTVEGNVGGVWLTTFFLWLCPAITEYFVDSIAVLKNPKARLEIHLRRQRWQVQAWLSELEPSKVLFREDEQSRLPIKSGTFIEYYPMQSARAIIGTRSQRMKPDVLESTGQLAGALLDIAVSRGTLSTKFPAANSDTTTRFITLQEICSRKFLSAYPNAMERFGWVCDNEFITMKTKVKTALEGNFKGRLGFGKDNLSNPNDLDAIMKAIHGCYVGFRETNGELMLPMHEDILMNIVEDSIHLAGEALLASICNSGLQYASFRPPQEPQLKKNAYILRRMLFMPSFKSKPHSCSYEELRAEAFEAAIPGGPSIMLENELAIVSNGYVAYSTILESVSGKMTDPRLASGIQVVPGSLRLTDGKGNPSTIDRGHYAKLLEKNPKDIVAGRIFCSRPTPLQAFDDSDAFKGFPALPDPNGTRVEHLITSSYDQDKKLLLTTQLHSAVAIQETGLLLRSQSSNFTAGTPPIPVSWNDSIRAIAFARHVIGYNVEVGQMRQLARHWRDSGYLGEKRLLWTQPGHEVVIETSKDPLQRRRYVSMTASNEQLRFFEAGYLCRERQLYVRHATPLEQCLKDAFEEIETEPDWAIIA